MQWYRLMAGLAILSACKASPSKRVSSTTAVACSDTVLVTFDSTNKKPDTVWATAETIRHIIVHDTVWMCPEPPGPIDSLAPNAPAGYIQAGSDYFGDKLLTTERNNTDGWWGAPGQMQTLSLTTDGLVELFPGKASPLTPLVWPANDYGGRAPSRWMMQNRIPKGTLGLYVRVKVKMSPNFTVWAAKPPPPFTVRAYNVGVKFIFIRAKGLTLAGDTITSSMNDFVGLLGISQANDSVRGMWHEPGATMKEGLTFTYNGQRWSPTGTKGWRIDGAPTHFLAQDCTRGVWCDVEMLFEIGAPPDTMSTYTLWLDGKQMRKGQFPSPLIGMNASGNGIPMQKVWWDYVWSDQTFGGGLNIPYVDQTLTFRSWHVRVKPVN
jgi:hypothetical protein